MGETTKTAIEAGQVELGIVMGALVAAALSIWVGKQVLKLI